MYLWYALVNKATNKIEMIVPATPYFLDEPFEDYRILCKPRSYTPRKFVGTKNQVKQSLNI